MLAQGVLQLDETQDELVDGPDQRAVVARDCMGIEGFVRLMCSMLARFGSMSTSPWRSPASQQSRR
jgi:hypothetical protein